MAVITYLSFIKWYFKKISNARKQDDFGANVELISWLSNFYLLARVGLSSLWTLFFPSVAKHQQTQRYKKRSIIREVFAKKNYANRSNHTSKKMISAEAQKT